MHVVGDALHGSSGDGPVSSNRIAWYCNEILKRTDGSGPISTIEFNRDGSHFAYGNADGIVSVVEMGLAEESEITHAKHTCSKPYQSFLSHQSEFDVLKSQVIEEKITIIRWLSRSAQSHFLLSCNERTIKLWRLSDVPIQNFSNMNFSTERGSRRKLIIRTPEDIRVPVCSTDSSSFVVRVWNKREFDRAHSFCITGLSPSIDRETFFSTDALRINLWHLEVTSEVFSILLPLFTTAFSTNDYILGIMDRPLDTVDDRTHLITGFDCSHVNPSIFAYCTNRGSVRVHDMRQSVNCDHPSIVFNSLPPDEANILALFVNSMSDVKMGNISDRYLFTRDYMTVKVWDMNMPTAPVEVYPVQTQLQGHLSVLYESESLCDDFKLSVSSDDRFIVSGSYNQLVKVFDRQAHSNPEYRLLMQSEEISPFVDPFRDPSDLNTFTSSLPDSTELPWPRIITEDMSADNGLSSVFGSSYVLSDFGRMSGVDLGRKWLQVSWRPGSYVVAVSHSDGIHLLEALL
ncbi:Serine/threonine-protein phosphatase 2A 55 kDa regulatory subunit B [Paragonimus westermani]|uniref:Serine/threonine-protein phosphatase 2A 55 kDa regulatory subunit B n=1 Tax=Paragonimus westermani TaxID=34504 RepID=A0A8T0DJV6_9TREM|nr:Serine/threonine-protein phosphatase 2A 55 kDa regulatory subunit B [Paragonimus westermani]